MFEVDEASRLITESCDPNANIIFGTSIDERYTGEIKITVIFIRIYLYHPVMGTIQSTNTEER